MKSKRASKAACAAAVVPACCRVEAMVNVDERGQMVLPKEVRERAGIRPGDKLAVVSWGGAGCCLALVKADALGGMVKDLLGPMLAEVAPGPRK
jgi:AbrB family looped-hinge helix DNA binding protein